MVDIYTLEEKEDVVTFCKSNTHEVFRDIIVHKNGMITRVSKEGISLETLRMIYEKENNMSDLSSGSGISIHVDTNDWYLNNTGCIVVKSEEFIKGTDNNLTKDQMHTLDVLRDNHKIEFEYEDQLEYHL